MMQNQLQDLLRQEAKYFENIQKNKEFNQEMEQKKQQIASLEQEKKDQLARLNQLTMPPGNVPNQNGQNTQRNPGNQQNNAQDNKGAQKQGNQQTQQQDNRSPNKANQQYQPLPQPRPHAHDNMKIFHHSGNPFCQCQNFHQLQQCSHRSCKQCTIAKVDQLTNQKFLAYDLTEEQYIVYNGTKCLANYDDPPVNCPHKFTYGQVVAMRTEIYE